MNPPACTDCKHMVKDTDTGKPLCARPGKGRRNVVDGGMLYVACDLEREDIDWVMRLFLGETCGEKAKFFQPKP